MSDIIREEISKPNTGERLVDSVQIIYKDGENVVVPVVDSGLLFQAHHNTKVVYSDWGDRATHHAVVMYWASDDTGDEVLDSQE